MTAAARARCVCAPTRFFYCFVNTLNASHLATHNWQLAGWMNIIVWIASCCFNGAFLEMLAIPCTKAAVLGQCKRPSSSLWILASAQHCASWGDSRKWPDAFNALDPFILDWGQRRQKARTYFWGPRSSQLRMSMHALWPTAKHVQTRVSGSPPIPAHSSPRSRAPNRRRSDPDNKEYVCVPVLPMPTSAPLSR